MLDIRKSLLILTPSCRGLLVVFKGVSLLKGRNNALFQVPSSSQFQFPDVLEAEFRLDPVVGLERMLRRA